MHNPLVIEAIMLIAAIIVGVWSQRALPLHADSRPILFLLCLSPALAAHCACCWIS